MDTVDTMGPAARCLLSQKKFSGRAEAKWGWGYNQLPRGVIEGAGVCEKFEDF